VTNDMSRAVRSRKKQPACSGNNMLGIKTRPRLDADLPATRRRDAGRGIGKGAAGGGTAGHRQQIDLVKAGQDSMVMLHSSDSRPCKLGSSPGFGSRLVLTQCIFRPVRLQQALGVLLLASGFVVSTTPFSRVRGSSVGGPRSTRNARLVPLMGRAFV